VTRKEGRLGREQGKFLPFFPLKQSLGKYFIYDYYYGVPTYMYI